jgi:hypothetical protein
MVNENGIPAENTTLEDGPKAGAIHITPYHPDDSIYLER